MIHILLSTYNGERYLKEQLDSIIAQTYTDWRLFVRDDGSTDDTQRIAEQYAEKDDRIRIIDNGKANIGAMRSFEYLLAQCGGADYYAFADQDDVWRSDKLALSLDAIQQAEKVHPNKPIVVHTDLKVVDEQLHEVAPSFWRYSNIRPDLLDTHIRYMAICNSVTGCTMLFNGLAREGALPIPDKAYMHDAWIALRTLLCGGQVVPLFCTPIAYRQHHDNTLGAVPYSLLGKSFALRKQGARLSYHMSHPEVYSNKVQFGWWKSVYLLHRVCSTYKQ